MSVFLVTDGAIIHALNEAAAGWFPELAVVAASWFVYLLAVLALVPIVSEGDRARGALITLRIAGGAAVASAIRMLIGAIAFRPRPFVADPTITLLVEKSADSPAFPSGHATAAFALAYGLFLWDRRVGTVALVVAVAVGIGRVAVGVHYPSDIIGGALLGILASWLVWRFAKK